jgi:hypothetical protein
MSKVAAFGGRRWSGRHSGLPLPVKILGSVAAFRIFSFKKP